MAFPITARRVVAPYNTMSELCTKPKAPSPRELSPQVTEGVSRPQATAGIAMIAICTMIRGCLPPTDDSAKSKTPPVSFAATLLGEEGKP